MRYWAIGWMILGAGMMGVLAGCEGDSPPEEASEYDPEIDAPPSNLVVRSDPDLLTDQALIAARDRKAREAIAGPKSPPAGGKAEDPAVVEVRQIMGQLIEAGKTGQLSVMLPYIRAADSDAMKGPITALSELAPAAAAFDKAVKENLAMKEVPAFIQQALAKGPGGGPTLVTLGDLATDALDYELDGNTVTVSGGNAPLKLTKDADGWHIDLSDADKAVYAALGELAAAQKRFVTTLNDGIRDAVVTKDNIDQKAMQLSEELVKPAMDKLTAAMGGGAGGSP
jgi:hypothetical protein